MEAPVVYSPHVEIHAAAAVYEAKRPWKRAEVDSTAEAFWVDDLLNFSSEEISGPIGENDFQLSDRSADSSIIFTEQVSNNSTSEKARDGIPNILEEEDLHVAREDIAQLEWLSTFVEDSFSTDGAMKPSFSSAFLGANSLNLSELSCNKKDQFQVMSPLSVLESSATSGRLETCVPGRARSKRSRAGVRIWLSSRLLSSNSCNSFDSISTNSTAAPSFFAFDCPTFSAETEFLTPEEWDRYCPPVRKKPTKVLGRKTGGQDASLPRRCTHCLAQRTPQWRAGPMGPKTLCNACGVRFKSGRLFPEYRPAGSPSFVSHQHSNSHRRVLQMRRHKLPDQHEEQQPQLPSAFQLPAKSVGYQEAEAVRAG